MDEKTDQSDIEPETLTNTSSHDGFPHIETIDDNITDTQIFSRFMVIRYFMCNQTQEVEAQRKFYYIK